MAAFGGPSVSSWSPGRLGNTEQFPDPFCDMASVYMPETIREALFWCDYIAHSQGPYRSAIDRVVSYFLTDVEITSLRDKPIGREEKEKYLDFLNDTLGIRDILHRVALDYMTYGNSFTSLIVPIRRALHCRGKNCGHEAPLRRIAANADYNFRWGDFNFNAKCPHCGYTGAWDHVDRRAVDEERLIFKRWSPHEIEIVHDPLTMENAYVWKIPELYRQQVKTGKPLHVLERAPWELVEIVQHNEFMLFDDDIIFHMRDRPMAGVDTGGWGLSRILVNFRQAWYLQILQRFNEAIALDHIVPFRVLTPAAKGGDPQTADPLLAINMGDFSSRVESMLRAWRRDPAQWNILPYGLEYQSLGGDATELAPKDLIELGLDMLLSSIGIPVELYKGTLSVQSAPAALRLFEATWSHLVYNLNRFLDDLVTKISQILSWEPVSARLTRVTHADDLNRQMAKLQLMMADRISRTTGLSSLGMDFDEETRRRLEEQKIESEAQQDAQKELESAAMMDEMAQPDSGGGGGGSPPPAGGAAPGGGGGAAQQFAAQQPLQPNMPVTPEDVEQRATTWAQAIQSMPASQKSSVLIQMKKRDPLTHALVKSMLADMEQQAMTQMKAQMQQQQQQPQQPGKTGAAKPPRDIEKDFGKPGRYIKI